MEQVPHEKSSRAAEERRGRGRAEEPLLVLWEPQEQSVEPADGLLAPEPRPSPPGPPPVATMDMTLTTGLRIMDLARCRACIGAAAGPRLSLSSAGAAGPGT